MGVNITITNLKGEDSASTHFLPHTLTLDLNDRSGVDFPRPKKIIEHAEQHCCSEHQAALIHRRSRRMVHRRPQAEEEYYDQVDNRDAIGEDS